MKDNARIAVISIECDGSVHAMHNPQFDLRFLGRMTMTRASDIRLNEDTQRFDIWVAQESGGFVYVPGAADFTTYDEARALEVQWFENCMLSRCSPLDDLGAIELLKLRYVEV